MKSTLITGAAIVAALVVVLSTRVVVPALVFAFRVIEAGFAPEEPVVAKALPVAVTPVVDVSVPSGASSAPSSPCAAHPSPRQSGPLANSWLGSAVATCQGCATPCRKCCAARCGRGSALGMCCRAPPGAVAAFGAEEDEAQWDGSGPRGIEPAEMKRMNCDPHKRVHGASARPRRTLVPRGAVGYQRRAGSDRRGSPSD